MGDRLTLSSHQTPRCANPCRCRCSGVASGTCGATARGSASRRRLARTASRTAPFWSYTSRGVAARLATRSPVLMTSQWRRPARATTTRLSRSSLARGARAAPVCAWPGAALAPPGKRGDRARVQRRDGRGFQRRRRLHQLCRRLLRRLPHRARRRSHRRRRRLHRLPHRARRRSHRAPSPPPPSPTTVAPEAPQEAKRGFAARSYTRT